MRLLDLFTNFLQENRDLSELERLQARLARFNGATEERRRAVCSTILERVLLGIPHAAHPQMRKAAAALLQGILRFDGLFAVTLGNVTGERATAKLWGATALARRELAVFEDRALAGQIEELLAALLHNIVPDYLPPFAADTPPQLQAPLYALYQQPALAVEAAIGMFLTNQKSKALFPRLWQQLELNLLTVSGINPNRESSKQVTPPTKAKGMTAAELVSEYLGHTPLADYFQTPVPFSIPLSARFAHTHVVGGSGHGKTQLLQSFILRDIEALLQGNGSIIVLDSQGDMIHTILQLDALTHISDRLILIDPNDIEHPPCLNLFDFGLARLAAYNPVEREKLINGAIALYEYLFGALLGADLTQRLGVIFRYLARLMMVVPGATIHTLREFMENPETVRPYLSKLDPTSKIFFETQFFAKTYDDTRRQILTRLWGVISNSVLARMFAHPRNRVDLFAAMNRGSLILINTAKDLLKQDGCEILGRFFLALIAQATQERAAIPEERRRATFLYIDEAQDYFDEGMEQLLNQARKYRVGLILAHQNLGQFEPRLQAAVMASTAIKLAGGVSAKDAQVLAREMRCAPELLQDMRKRSDHSEFACFIRNLTPCPIKLSIPFGQMESRPRMSASELQTLLRENARRYCAGSSELAQQAPAPDANEMGQPEVL